MSRWESGPAYVYQELIPRQYRLQHLTLRFVDLFAGTGEARTDVARLIAASI
jgi:hypothetical protein